MRKIPKTLVAIIIICIVFLTSCSNHQNYDFYATSEDGNRLFYKIVGGEVHVVPELPEFSKTNFTYFNNPPVGSLIIPEIVTHDGFTYVVTEIEENTFVGCKFYGFILPITMKKIGPFAFANCQNITGINIPNSVTEIGYDAFDYCSGLKSIHFGESLEIIGNSVFQGCKEIEKIVVNDNNKVFDSRENCNGVIRTCDNTLIIACKNTDISSSVENIGEYAFYNGLPDRILERVNNLPIIKTTVLEGWR